MKKRIIDLKTSKCEGDYKGRHSWEKLGVIRDKAGNVFLIWRCSQCDKCISEALDFVV